jgi:ankyrin repeat protein
VIQELIKLKFPLNYGKNNGVTALGVASFRGNLQVVQMLVDGGADLN